MDAVPTLVGIAGHVKGEEFPLEYGKKVIVGRSRSVDWSLVSLESWTTKSKQEQEDDHAFRTISGKHFEVTMYNLGSIEVVNLSSNGTRLDGNALDRQTITDIATNAHEIAFGADEVVRLELRGGDAGEGEAAKELDSTLEKIDESDESDKSDKSDGSDESDESDEKED
jgi:pSer/pThr/pTyr-binding forkhead associated (FHA) protein